MAAYATKVGIKNVVNVEGPWLKGGKKYDRDPIRTDNLLETPLRK